jgi:hypothetical protein
MTLSCPRKPREHDLFKRVVTVQGPTIAMLDEHGDVLKYEDCNSFRQIHSSSDVRCASCGEKPVINITK